MSQEPKDYSHEGRFALLALIVVLIGISFIPPQEVSGVKLRRANILSDLVSFEEKAEATSEEEQQEEVEATFDEEEFKVDLEEVSQKIEADTTPKHITTSYDWFLDRQPIRHPKPIPDSIASEAELTPMEDYSQNGEMNALLDKLLHSSTPVRIAFMGDSFVEGDILTCDFRERLQLSYGGGGCGFAPMSSPLTGFRRTVKTTAKGWTSYNIMQRKRAPEYVKENFFISGWASTPQAGASTRWQATDYKRQLEACTKARVWFKSPHTSHLEVMLNDTLKQQFTIEGDESVRQIVVSAPQIASLEFRVKDGTQGFIGYGAVFEGEGMVVDNYSIRSNNGQAMFHTNPIVNRQINEFVDYDLVILQYGLNIMQQGVRSYKGYSLQISKMINYVRRCFPHAAVLVLGVSERCVKGAGGFQTMDAVEAMTQAQRTAAKEAGAIFWPTSEGMAKVGGMKTFVANGWAGKDYTHINYAGGRRIALSLFDALNHEARQLWVEERMIEMRRRNAHPIVDSLHMEQLQTRMIGRGGMEKMGLRK